MTNNSLFHKSDDGHGGFLLMIDLKTLISYAITICFTCVVSSFSVYFIFQDMVDKGIVRSETVLSKDIAASSKQATDALALSLANSRDINALQGDMRELTTSHEAMFRMVQDNAAQWRSFEQYMRSRMDQMANN